MTSTSPTKPAKEALRFANNGRNAFSGRIVTVLLISVVMAQLALLGALYVQNIQLSNDVGKFKVKAETFRELVDKNGECRCPVCPAADEYMRTSLAALHEKFEKTSEKLNKGVESVDRKVAAYGKKFESLIKKVQNFMPMQGFNL